MKQLMSNFSNANPDYVSKLLDFKKFENDFKEFKGCTKK